MRKILAVLLAGLFLILFFIATTVNQVVDTASDPDVITGMLDDADLYNYVYDDIIGSLVRDTVEKGIEFESGLDEGSAPTILHFNDPDAAALAIADLIETLVPREYVQEKFEESLAGVVPYARGDTDEFTIDLEVQDRVRAVPDAVRKLVMELGLTERVVDDLLVPHVGQFADQISGEGLGIEFTSAEIEEAAREIFEPLWLEGQLFGAIDEVVPFFAGDSESFNVVVEFDDRAEVVGQVLKNKLTDQDTLYTLVFAQVVDPLIQQTVASTTSVGFGISLSEAEVVEAFEIIAPRAWVEEQGEGVIDALVDYMVGKSDALEYRVDLSDRKVAATNELQALARGKLESTVGDIPECTTRADELGAALDLGIPQLPRCIAGGQIAIDLALSTIGPLLDAQVSSFVEVGIPNEVAYTRADLEAKAGGNFDSIDDIREQFIEGVSYSDQDLIDTMADENDRESRADAEETLKILADGILITERNITDNLEPEDLQQFNDARGYAGTALDVRWLLWVLVLIPLAVIALIGGNGWGGRLKWAGAVAAISAVIVYGGIAAAWSFYDASQDAVPEWGLTASEDFRADYPRLSAELESPEPAARLERMLESWQAGWRNQTLPWMLAGIVAFIAGLVISMQGRKRGVAIGGGTTYKGSSTAGTTAAAGAAAGAFAIPKDWGDDDEEDNVDAKIESEKPVVGDEESSPRVSGDSGDSGGGDSSGGGGGDAGADDGGVDG
jgi:uncharacterized membrane protein YgcG